MATCISPGCAARRADGRASPGGKRTLHKQAGARKHLPDVSPYSVRDLLLEDMARHGKAWQGVQGGRRMGRWVGFR